MEGSSGCLGAAVGVSTTVGVTASFAYWRRGLLEVGVSDWWSWPLAVAGSLVLLALSYALPRLFVEIDDDMLGRALFVAVPVVVGVGWGYLTIVRRGGAPSWITSPPEIYELVWRDPPWPVRWALTTVIGLVGWASFEGARRRR